MRFKPVFYIGCMSTFKGLEKITKQKMNMDKKTLPENEPFKANTSEAHPSVKNQPNTQWPIPELKEDVHFYMENGLMVLTLPTGVAMRFAKVRLERSTPKQFRLHCLQLH